MLQDAACLLGDGVIERIDLAEAVEAPDAKDSLVVLGKGDRSGNEAGVAALRHDGDAGSAAELHGGGDFLGGGGADHEGRCALVAPTLLFQVGCDLLRIADHALVAERGDEALLQGGKVGRSEEHTSELQSLMRISYAVFCL